MMSQGQEGRLRLAYDVKKPQILTTVLELLQKELEAVTLAARDYDYSSSSVSSPVAVENLCVFAAVEGVLRPHWRMAPKTIVAEPWVQLCFRRSASCWERYSD
jgi:hypothetical protein